MVGVGDEGMFTLNETEDLLAEELDLWLDGLQGAIPGKITVVYDGCRSFSFLSALEPPAGTERLLLAGSGANEPAFFLFDGDISFSKYFWMKVLDGDNVRDAFLHAKHSIEYACHGRTPRLDDNGNGVGNEKTDGQLARYYTIGYGIMLAGDDPLVGSVSPDQELTGGETTATVWAEDVTTTGTVDQVWAVITAPGQGTGGPICPGFDPSRVDLIPAGGGRYEVDYGSFTDFGTYEIAVHAIDAEGNVSEPKETTVFQGTGPDEYEVDDTYGQAGIIVLNDPKGQTHGFHDAGDQDWVKFYAAAGETYTVETGRLGSNCDTVIEVYGTDGSMLLASRDDGGTGEDETLDWSCPAAGVYYVKVRHHNPAAYGDGNQYDLKVYKPIGPFSGFIEGLVRDAATGAPLGNAQLRTNQAVTAITGSDGRYFMVHPPGSYTLTVSYTGYSSWTGPVAVAEATTVTKNVSMTTSGNGGSCAADASADASTQTPVRVEVSWPFNLLALLMLSMGVLPALRTLRRREQRMNLH